MTRTAISPRFAMRIFLNIFLEHRYKVTANPRFYRRLRSHEAPGFCLILFRRNAGKADGKGSLGFVLVRAQPAAAGENAVADQGPDRETSVGVPNFFAFDGGAWVVGDRYFLNLLAHAAQLGGHLGAELKAAA